MAKKSAGILLFKVERTEVLVMLVHPGGPFFGKKDMGAWSIPKGEFNDSEDPLNAAKREFHEETGFIVEGEFITLSPVKQKSGKVVYAWAVQGDLDTSEIHSNTFQIVWPPKSGKMKTFPEIDKAEWFDFETAKIKILAAQLPFLIELIGIIYPKSP